VLLNSRLRDCHGSVGYSKSDFARCAILSRTEFVDRAATDQRAVPKAQPKFGGGEVLKRIRTVWRENLQRLDDDVATLTKYLKTEGAPKAAIDLLTTPGKEQRNNWRTAIDRIQELLSE
jgi:hypothetical protein